MTKLIKNAFLIMCHKNIKQVKRLIERLSNEYIDIFIHIDSCCKEISDIEELYNLKINNLYLVPREKSIHGILDDRSLVDITILMIKLAKSVELDNNVRYQYYCLMSGQDYLIKPINYIVNNLNINYPTPYIDCTPYSKNNWIFYKFNKNLFLRKLYLKHIEYNKNKFTKFIFKSIHFILVRLLQLLKKTEADTLSNLNVQLYGGSAWWILPDKIIEYILSQLNEKYVDFLLKTNTPEETFFQIMSMRSPLNEFIHINPKEQVIQSCNTWAYFYDVNKPFVGHPYIFTVNEFDKLKNSKFWFARKFDINIDNEILNLIDKNLL